MRVRIAGIANSLENQVSDVGCRSNDVLNKIKLGSQAIADDIINVT